MEILHALVKGAGSIPSPETGILQPRHFLDDEIVKNDGVLCLEVVANQMGEILPHHLEQIKAIGKNLGKIK